MKRPLLIVTISYILGIIIGVYFQQSILFILLTGITGIVFWKIIKKKKIVIIAICIVPCLLSCQQTNNLNNKYNKMYKLADENIAMTGTVCSQIKETDYKYSVNIKLENKFLIWLKEFLSFKKLLIETILKVTYVILAIFITLTSFNMIGTSFFGFLLYLIIGNVVLRIIYESSLIILMIWKNTSEINKKMK